MRCSPALTRRQVWRFSARAHAGPVLYFIERCGHSLCTSPSPWLVETDGNTWRVGCRGVPDSHAALAACRHGGFVGLIGVVVHHQGIDLRQRTQLGRQRNAVGRGTFTC